uniref:Uncharacterized protein n=1 Tax=Triticum urartu TaxID=4572 RepID=A0A8R7JYP6_TRIUA
MLRLHHKRSFDCVECIPKAQKENGRISQNLTRCKGTYRVWAYVKLSLEAAIMLGCKKIYLFMITVRTSIVQDAQIDCQLA